jgi:UDP-N-acetylglucosamine 2-epimerase (non-hydrolysing)/GDP/UDP-N,N'-diacetylbacillosamine 2-epimerase (hydrolysing)
MPKRKIAVVTGSRAEYGLLYWLMTEIKNDPDLQLQVIATGMHLAPEFGLTYKAIEADGFIIDAKVEMLLSSDTSVGVAKSIGLGVIGFADAIDRLRPDILVLLGDRFEILAAAQAAMVARIPVAHVSGGEVTEGAIDDSIRHAITKMAHFHFVAAEPYRKRVIQMGEHPERVINCGDPGLDNLKRLKLLSRLELERQLDFSLGAQYFLVTYHPATLSMVDPKMAMQELCAALDHFPHVKIIMTKPNADMGGRELAKMVDEYASKYPDRIFASTSLGQIRYLSAMKHCDVVIGNSSSGIVEAPGLHKPTVNLGARQNGRLKATSIIDCSEQRRAIIDAIELALSPEFGKKAAKTKSLYGDCNASRQMKEFFKHVDYGFCMNKGFYDSPCAIPEK